MKKPEARELALIVAVLVHNEIIDGKIFETFDRLFEIAKAFLVKYGVDTRWGVNLEYEETVYKFGKEYAATKEWKF
jgi:hypothetical protein